MHKELLNIGKLMGILLLVDELVKVRGIGEKTLEKIKPFIKL